MEIPISNILLLCLIFLLIGGVVMILLQYLIFIKFSNLPDESEEQKQANAKYTLPLVSSWSKFPCSIDNFQLGFTTIAEHQADGQEPEEAIQFRTGWWRWEWMREPSGEPPTGLRPGLPQLCHAVSLPRVQELQSGAEMVLSQAVHRAGRTDFQDYHRKTAGQANGEK